ncbi:MAG: LysM peptidoglycan-binding domain-containing protein [Chloroflexota bacterium]
MRSYRLLDEALDEDDEYPQVVSIGTAQRGRSGGTVGLGRRAPWTPRDGVAPSASPRRAETIVVHESRGFTRTHQWMIAIFAIVCVGMVLGMVLVRVWDEASRAVAALPPDGRPAVVQQPAPTPAPPPQAAPADAPPGAGPVTTEIRVLEPNYTVAPGDSLGIIARRHGTSVDALASINNIDNRNSLSVGQKLIIP